MFILSVSAVTYAHKVDMSKKYTKNIFVITGIVFIISDLWLGIGIVIKNITISPSSTKGVSLIERLYVFYDSMYSGIVLWCITLPLTSAIVSGFLLAIMLWCSLSKKPEISKNSPVDKTEEPRGQVDYTPR